jgi:CBS domain-containing protein
MVSAPKSRAGAVRPLMPVARAEHNRRKARPVEGKLARPERRRQGAEKAMHVGRILKEKGSDVVTTEPERTIAETAKLLDRHRIGAVLVLGADGSVAGVLSERDVVRGIARHGERALSMAVRDLMTREVIVCEPKDTVQDVMGLMTHRRIRHVPVVEDGRLVGIVSIGDVVKGRLGDFEMEAESLRAYVQGAF